jgi:hypothetical protein
MEACGHTVSYDARFFLGSEGYAELCNHTGHSRVVNSVGGEDESAHSLKHHRSARNCMHAVASSCYSINLALNMVWREVGRFICVSWYFHGMFEVLGGGEFIRGETPPPPSSLPDGRQKAMFRTLIYIPSHASVLPVD